MQGGIIVTQLLLLLLYFLALLLRQFGGEQPEGRGAMGLFSVACWQHFGFEPSLGAELSTGFHHTSMAVSALYICLFVTKGQSICKKSVFYTTINYSSINITPRNKHELFRAQEIMDKSLTLFHIYYCSICSLDKY